MSKIMLVAPLLKIGLSLSADKMYTFSYESENSLIVSDSVHTPFYKTKLKDSTQNKKRTGGGVY